MATAEGPQPLITYPPANAELLFDNGEKRDNFFSLSQATEVFWLLRKIRVTLPLVTTSAIDGPTYNGGTVDLFCYDSRVNALSEDYNQSAAAMDTGLGLMPKERLLLTDSLYFSPLRNGKAEAFEETISDGDVTIRVYVNELAGIRLRKRDDGYVLTDAGMDGGDELEMDGLSLGRSLVVISVDIGPFLDQYLQELFVYCDEVQQYYDDMIDNDLAGKFINLITADYKNAGITFAIIESYNKTYASEIRALKFKVELSEWQF